MKWIIKFPSGFSWISTLSFMQIQRWDELSMILVRYSVGMEYETFFHCAVKICLQWKRCFGPSPARGHFLKEMLFWELIPFRICPYKGIFLKDLPYQATVGRRQPPDLIPGLGPEHFFTAQ